MAKYIKAQISTEMLVLIGILLLGFGVVLYYEWTQSAENLNKMNSYYTDLLSSTLASNIDTVENMGVGASNTVKISIPEAVSEMDFINSGKGGEVVLKVKTAEGISEITRPVGARFKQTYNYTFDGATVLYIKIENTGEGISIEKVE